MQSRGVSRARFGILSWLIVVGLSLLAPGNLSSGEQAKLTASDAAAGDRFGLSVSIEGDTAVIGAHFDDDAGSLSGSAYVFVRSAGIWSQQAKLTAGDAAAGDRFGVSVSIEGDTVVVGAFLDGDAGFASGSAYVFVRSGTSWTQQAKLTASDAAIEDQFGFSVSIEGDTAVVGAFADDDAGSFSGSAYVFELAELTPQEAIQVLVGDVIALNLKTGIENSLDAKLDAVVQAIDDLNQNNDVAAINSLQAFINSVEAQRGIHITDAQADALIAAAQAIITLLGG